LLTDGRTHALKRAGGAVAMTVIIEFSLPADSFPFGRSTSGDPSVRVQLERLVPLREDRIPFLWATGQEFEQFEQHLRNSDIVKDAEAVTRVGDSVLYYTEWYTDKESFLNGISDTNGTIMEAHGDGDWSFTIRFRDHADLTRFHQYYQDNDFPVHIDRVYAPDEESRTEYGFGLTPEQREALIMAVEKGYFSVPRETKLEEIADVVGITQQAASERVRRGAETVLRKSLIGLVAENFEPEDEGTADTDATSEE
jgi:predicted DNA binding protein